MYIKSLESQFPLEKIGNLNSKSSIRINDFLYINLQNLQFKLLQKKDLLDV